MPEVRMSDSEEEVSSGHVSRNSLNPSPNRELDTFKHPLQNKWTLWYYKNDRSKDWESNQKQVRIKFLLLQKKFCSFPPVARPFIPPPPSPF